MASLLLLGTGAALADGNRETTMLALRGASTTVLVDCGGNAVRGLQQMQAPLDSLERLIITHSHPDHTLGFALLVEMLWLAGRRSTLPVHGPADALDLVRRVFEQWDTSGWDGLFELDWRPVALEQGAEVAQGEDFDIVAAPGAHSVPVIGLRATHRQSGHVLAYSADGEPSDGVRWLARDADLLVHEATGSYKGHSTLHAAAELAAGAGAGRLVLVHIAKPLAAIEAEAQAVRAVFGGGLFVGRDLDRYEI